MLCNRVDKLTKENAELTQIIEQKKNDLEYYESEAGLEVNAWLQGWVRP